MILFFFPFHPGIGQVFPGRKVTRVALDGSELGIDGRFDLFQSLQDQSQIIIGHGDIRQERPGPTILNLKLRHFCLALGQAGSGAWRYIRKWREMGTPVEREPAILLGSKPDEIATGPGSQGSNRNGDFVTQKHESQEFFVWG